MDGLDVFLIALSSFTIPPLPKPRKIIPELKEDYIKAYKSYFMHTGDHQVAKELGLLELRRSWAETSADGSGRLTKHAPELEYPSLSADAIKQRFETDLAAQGFDPETTFLRTDEQTRTESKTMHPTYALTVNGSPLTLPDGAVLRWKPNEGLFQVAGEAPANDDMEEGDDLKFTDEGTEVSAEEDRLEDVASVLDPDEDGGTAISDDSTDNLARVKEDVLETASNSANKNSTSMSQEEIEEKIKGLRDLLKFNGRPRLLTEPIDQIDRSAKHCKELYEREYDPFYLEALTEYRLADAQIANAEADLTEWSATVASVALDRYNAKHGALYEHQKIIKKQCSFVG